MDVTNAFIGNTKPPSSEELAAALGPSLNLWNELINWMGTEFGTATQEWKGVCVHKYGWTLRLLNKKRTIFYLSPCAGCFRIALTLSDKAVAAARDAKLPKHVLLALATAPRYPEGTGLRLVVHRAQDLPAIRKLAEIKSLH